MACLSAKPLPDRTTTPQAVSILPMRSPPKPSPRPPATQPNTPEGERLAKRVAVMLVCSRSDAERYIEGGWVSVDGVVVEEPQFRVAGQAIAIDPEASLLELAPVTLLLHKPAGYEYGATIEKAPRKLKFAQQLLSSATHADNDAADTRVLKRHFAKLTPGVPLETGASGLVVFTQDWRVARKLEEDAGTMEQEVMVEVAGAVSPEALQRLHYGFGPDKQSLPALKASVSSTSDAATKLRFAVKGSRPGLIAYLCERSGLQILSMKRLRVGRVSMAQLASGQWRYLQGFERF
jgi:23S rRNA pseudouridine2604 synthase